jgi:hypothetical protein
MVGPEARHADHLYRVEYISLIVITEEENRNEKITELVIR